MPSRKELDQRLQVNKPTSLSVGNEEEAPTKDSCDDSTVSGNLRNLGDDVIKFPLKNSPTSVRESLAVDSDPQDVKEHCGSSSHTGCNTIANTNNDDLLANSFNPSCSVDSNSVVLRTRKKKTTWRSIFGTILRSVIVDIPLFVLSGLYISMVVLERVHDEYLLPQMQLMEFLGAERDFTDVTYYHRLCTEQDITATSVDQLVIDSNATREDAVNHMLRHGATMYPNLISPETAWALREMIVEENKKQEGWFVIENDNRFSWGIDINMHPALHTYWKELASNVQLVQALQDIVGPNPAIIEFTAITSTFGAKDQYDHQDVVPPGSGAKFAQTFIPSYSLFIPLQDTTYEMGATHVCPGSHLCSDGCQNYCPNHNLAMSGENNLWRQGWGALLNQQITHKGMGHTDPNALDRVVLVATFAPRPQTFRGLERRMIAQGGSYSLLWSQWGHTFYDFAHAETRMQSPVATLRSLGLINGDGWNLISVASMRIINEEAGYHDHNLEDFLETGGFKFLPQSWQGNITENEDDNVWHEFLLDTAEKTKSGLMNLNIIIIGIYLTCTALFSGICLLANSWWSSSWRGSTFFFRCLVRLLLTNMLLLGVAGLVLQKMAQTNWARNIRNGKAHQLPDISDVLDETPGTLPLEMDVLIAPQYSSDYLASYTKLLDLAHPGNKNWKDTTKLYAHGYVQLTPELQQQFARTMVRWIHETPSRFLVPNKQRKWTTINDNSLLATICHKELVMASNSLTDALQRQLDSLRAETQWGLFESKHIHRSTIPTYLKKWEECILPRLNDDRKTRSEILSRMTSMKIHSIVQYPTPRMRTTQTFSKRQFELPESLTSERVANYALEEGDIVEGMYKCEFNEWYRGTVEQVYADEGTMDVRYDDGDLDERLNLSCVRPFEPFQIGELVELRDGNDTFHRARVEKIHVYAGSGGRYDLRRHQGGLLPMVSPADMRRFTSTYQVGSKVEARFGGGAAWYPGTVSCVNPDGSYDIYYDDGDFEQRVPLDKIRM